jgi:hypothetical protein
MSIKYRLRNIKNYPDNGNHQEVVFESFSSLPFEIRKGEDCGWYDDKHGKIHGYNTGEVTTKKWIAKLTDESNKSLKDIFEIKVMLNVDKLIDYCVKLYKRSISLEIERLRKVLQLIGRDDNAR